MNIIKDKEKEDEVLFEKLNTLTEVFQFYPLIVKKDKNKSHNIHYVLNSHQTPELKVVLTNF